MKRLLVLFVFAFAACSPAATPDPLTPTGDPESISTPTGAPRPADTPVPTKTRKPTATPSPTPKPLEIRAGASSVEYGYYTLVGEVVNDSDSRYEFVKVIGAFYDDSGTLIANDSTYIELEQLPPHGVALFRLSTGAGGKSDQIASYELQSQARETSEEPYADLEATVSQEYEQYGYYNLVGQAANTGSSDCEYFKILVGFYDSGDQLIGVNSTYTDLDEVPAGSHSTFNVSAKLPGKYDHYDLWTQCRPK